MKSSTPKNYKTIGKRLATVFFEIPSSVSVDPLHSHIVYQKSQEKYANADKGSSFTEKKP